MQTQKGAPIKLLNRFQISYICFTSEARRFIKASGFFFCRILSARFWDTNNSTIKKAVWQPYSAKYP